MERARGPSAVHRRDARVGRRGGRAAGVEKADPAGGHLLFGDGCWESSPTQAAARIFGDSVDSLAEIVGHAHAAGWRVLHVDTADQREWDEFESAWRGGREEWLRSNPESPSAPSVTDQLDARVNGYVRGYCGVLGFCYLVLGAADRSG